MFPITMRLNEDGQIDLRRYVEDTTSALHLRRTSVFGLKHRVEM
jgi:hypothetical protein